MFCVCALTRVYEYVQDPVLVSLWVGEQFTSDRMEVNVVGDFDEKHLLKQLDLMLGHSLTHRIQ